MTGIGKPVKPPACGCTFSGAVSPPSAAERRGSQHLGRGMRARDRPEEQDSNPRHHRIILNSFNYLHETTYQRANDASTLEPPRFRWRRNGLIGRCAGNRSSRGTRYTAQADPKRSCSRSRAGTYIAPILQRNRPFPGARAKGLGHQRHFLLDGVTRPIILPTSPSSDDAWPSLNEACCHQNPHALLRKRSPAASRHGAGPELVVVIIYLTQYREGMGFRKRQTNEAVARAERAFALHRDIPSAQETRYYPRCHCQEQVASIT